MTDTDAVLAAAQAELERRILDPDDVKKVPMPVLLRIIDRYTAEQTFGTPIDIVDPVVWARSLGVPPDRQRDLLAARIGVSTDVAATMLASHKDEEEP